MKFLLYSLNHYPELTGIGKYNGEMVSTLVEMSTDVSVLCAPPYYPEWKIKREYASFGYVTETSDDAVVYRCPLYVPSNVTTLKRLLHLFSFSVSSGLRLFSLFKLKPDLVFLVQPTFFCAPATLLYCKLTGAKSVMHIQDYELDAMLGLGMGGGKIANFLKKVESWIMSKFDLVSTISYSMIDNARTKGVPDSKLLLFPNWADVSFVTPDTAYESFKERLGLEPADKVILYAGNMGKKQGLEIVLDAAESFKERPDLKFLMVGAGAHAEVLKGLAKQKQLTNMLFLPLQAWDDVPAMLAMADIHLVIQKKGAADAVLPSKLTNILAAGGQSIITAELCTELGQLAEKFPGIYDLIEPESAPALVEAINKQLANEETGHNLVARSYAEENLDRNKIIDRFLHDVQAKLSF
ncbi:WcaI family glycosyltransferase [Alteromonas oceani]|uniref:WcaI family glycosyltransferase n=1 Tax=Alteromonas oceani TaxID=2071609 RepID=A0ABV7JQ93_9ALTE|nr:WcaI family glycosyltransferase [Alteromonas oceani]